MSAAGLGLLDRGFLTEVWPDRLVPLVTLRPVPSGDVDGCGTIDGLVVDLTGMPWEKLALIWDAVPSSPGTAVLDEVRELWLPAERFSAVMTPEDARALAWHFPAALDLLTGTQAQPPAGRGARAQGAGSGQAPANVAGETANPDGTGRPAGGKGGGEIWSDETAHLLTLLVDQALDDNDVAAQAYNLITSLAQRVHQLEQELADRPEAFST
jgi:hypothetical protein